MSSQLMLERQHSSTPSAAQWALQGGEALRLEIGPGLRELHVTEGRLWLTRDSTEKAAAEDVWLVAGDTLSLESGSQWVAEGWGATRFQLLVPPQACARASRSRGTPAPCRVSSSLSPAMG